MDITRSPFMVLATPSLVADWTGPAVDGHAIVSGIPIYLSVKLGYCAVREGAAVYLDTRRPEVRDLLARRLPSFRWIAGAEASGAASPMGAAALWWWAAHHRGESYANLRTWKQALGDNVKITLSMPWGVVTVPLVAT